MKANKATSWPRSSSFVRSIEDRAKPSKDMKKLLSPTDMCYLQNEQTLTCHLRAQCWSLEHPEKRQWEGAITSFSGSK